MGGASCAGVFEVTITQKECTPSASGDFSCECLSVSSTNQKRHTDRRTYCNIFCIINVHLHLPIKSSKKIKKIKKKKSDESRRVCERRPSVHEPRTVEVALLIIELSTISEERLKNTMREKISSSVLLHDSCFFLSSVIGLFLIPPSPNKEECLHHETCSLDYEKKSKQIIEMN